MNRYYETLELHKILKMLSDLCADEFTKHAAETIEPIIDFEKVNEMMRSTSDAYSLAVKYGSPGFRAFRDVRPSVHRAYLGTTLSFRELLDFADFLGQIRQLSDWYTDTHEEENEISFSYLLVSLCPNKYLEERIKDTFLSDDEVADTASPQLANIRRKIVQAEVKIRAHLDRLIRNPDVASSLQESIVTMRDGRFVLPVKAEHKSKVSGLVHASSATGNTYFIEPTAVVEANNEIRILEAEEAAEIERIAAELSGHCADMKETIESDFVSVCELALYFAKVNLGAKMRGMIPTVTQDGKILLKKARHPLIDPKKVVPVNIQLGFDYDALIVTGPNTGGKTVLLKTAGLLCAMAMCGLMLPCGDGTSVSVFDKILVDIGDRQSIEESLSTFSSHMSNVSSIIKEANKNTLVLLDELGSGTDPVEGAALAVAIIEKLKSLRAKQIVITHFQELKIFATHSKGVQNASCEFDLKTLKPTYNLIIGSPGKSNAFYISENLGIPRQVINEAKKLISEENLRFEEAVSNLEKARRETETLNEKIRIEKREADEKLGDLKKQLSDLEKRRNDEIEKARIQAMRIVESTRLQSEQLMAELQSLKKERDRAEFNNKAQNMKSFHRQSMNKMYETANPVSQKKETYRPPRDLKKGDNVILTDTGRIGVVINEPDKNADTVMIQAGVMKMKMPLSLLRLAEEKDLPKQKEPDRRTKKAINLELSRNVRTDIDIHGLAVDEGIHEVDAFIDEAVLNGLNTVTIIHGKGTGTLRRGIQQFLRSHPSVKSCRSGLYGEGEEGVTIVELKK
ncbi:MAG: endonuclease MutS2 [Ruminococcus sp.]|jgi:DNA mismatch repair protein MutS2|nr:endonuclease MutS2 [Ruminococcus sp.]